MLREFELRDAEIWFAWFALDPALQILAVGNIRQVVFRTPTVGRSSSSRTPREAHVGHSPVSSRPTAAAFAAARRSIWKWAPTLAAITVKGLCVCLVPLGVLRLPVSCVGSMQTRFQGTLMLF